MKYEFIRVDDDTTKLKYKDKEFDIKKTVGLLEKLQKVNYKAKMTMMKELAKEGISADELTIKKTEGNKIIEDKSNLLELEKYYTGIESQNLYDEVLKEATGMSFAELIVDIGLDYTSIDEMQKFTIELTKTITAPKETPSEEVL